jgi:hypothetical protein
VYPLFYNQTLALLRVLQHQDMDLFASPEDKVAEPKKLGWDISAQAAADAPEGIDADAGQESNIEGKILYRFNQLFTGCDA